MSTAARDRFTPLAIQELSRLASELQTYKHFGALFSTGKGQYKGHILGFVKGLRLSAQLIYFLRNCLSTESLEVSWGHIIDESTDSCSPECDVIIHKPGHLTKWNGGTHPVMDFKFIRAKDVLGVVSCKSILATIDEDYVPSLKALGVPKIYIFAECCSHSNYNNLNSQAKLAGYEGLWCTYFSAGTDDDFFVDERHHAEFHRAVRQAFCVSP